MLESEIKIPWLTFRFVTCNDTISKLIRWRQDFWASHVEAVLDEDWRTLLPSGSTFGTLSNWTLGAHLSGGIQLRHHDYEKFSQVEYARLPVTAASKLAMMAYAASSIGQPYDCIDIAGIMFEQNWSDQNHAICSVFATRLCLAGKMDLLRIDPERIPSITPRDFYLSPYLQKVA